MKNREQNEMLSQEITLDSLNQSSSGPVAFSTLTAHLLYLTEVTADNLIMLSEKEMISGRDEISTWECKCTSQYFFFSA